MQPITSSFKNPTRSAQYITCIKSKARLDISFHMYYMHQGLPCSKGKLVSVALDVCCPPSSCSSASFSYGKTPMTTGPTCDDKHNLLIKCFDSKIKLNLFNSNPTILFDIFHG
jgi:hypothetical protein